MAALLTALEIKQEVQDSLSPDVFVAEELIMAMQVFHEQMPDNSRKDALTTTIIQLIGEVMTEANK